MLSYNGTNSITIGMQGMLDGGVKWNVQCSRRQVNFSYTQTLVRTINASIQGHI